MTAFTLLDPNIPMLVVDLFTEAPLDFEQMWQRAKQVQLDTTRVKVASLATSSR